MLDYETRKSLEEAWLLEMAYTKKKVGQICEQYADPFMVHLCKCFLFKDTEWYDHWMQEACSFCVRCDDIRLKPNSKRPNREFFMQDDYICEEIETPKDAQGYLNLAIDKCPELSREDATLEEGENFLKMWNTLRIILADQFSSENTLDRNEFRSLIEQQINRNQEE